MGGIFSSQPAPSETLRKRFAEADQSHVFKFLDEGKVPRKQIPEFLAQLEEIDLDYVSKSYTQACAEVESLAKHSSVDLAPPDSYGTLAGSSEEELASWEQAGLAAIACGEVAACVLAGGQGTRLGFDGPKGCYDVGLPSGKTLFQIFAERVRRMVVLAGQGARLPFLVMTSPQNHQVTLNFFKAHKFFGLPAKDVHFFQQGTMPCLTPEGKIILESAGCVARNPDGNGGFYPALQNSGCLGQLRSEGVKYIHVFSVDNILCRPADARFIGYCIAQGADCGNKCVWKAHPGEKVGIVAKKNNRPAVVEYSELDDASKNLCDDAGRLVFGAGNICNHFFTVDFLVDKVLPNMAFFFHLAKKKIPYAGEDGTTIKPDAENGLKLESFIFDTFCLSENMAIFETLREEEFSPVKNPSTAPSDTPSTACAMLNNLARAWIRKAGGSVEGDDDALVEVSPLLSYAGEGLEERVAGKTFTAPIHIVPN